MFRFTIRDLLWLTLVVALGMGWWLDRQRLRDDCQELQMELQRANGRATLLEFMMAPRPGEGLIGP